MSKIPSWLQQARDGWRYKGQQRPPFAIAPKAGEESVWDYPRPPRIENDKRLIVVKYGDQVLAETRRAIRVLETASAPTFYISPSDIDMSCIQPGQAQSTFCEWKGPCHYWSVSIAGVNLVNSAWQYTDTFDEFRVIDGYFSFYPSMLDCFIDSVKVRPQPGGFYGGWVTDDIIGPIKGEPGSRGW